MSHTDERGAVCRRVRRVRDQVLAARRRARQNRSARNHSHNAGTALTHQTASWLNDLVFDRHRN
ncbi:MAG: hypothetical protein H0T92_11785 [Pyrinomonadaceae bacterium]|nr:hypothetical protein [Pyrinomonadaceae bacterium]